MSLLEVTVFGSVNILLVLVLLFCHYFCLGQQARGRCGNPACLDSRETGWGEETGSVGDCSRRRNEAATYSGSSPIDRTPSGPKTPNGCLCEGALAGAVNRSDEVNLASLLPAMDSIFCGTVSIPSLLDGFGNVEAPLGDESGRDVCFTLCTLLL